MIILQTEADSESFHSIVHGNPLWQAFVTPFTDIMDTAAYAIKRIGSVSTQELNSILHQAMITLLPFIGSEAMDAIEANAKANITRFVGQLDQQYADVINRNIDAIFSHADSWGLLFLFNPGIILGTQFVIKFPIVAGNLIGGMLGGKDVRATNPEAVPTTIGDKLATLSGDLQRLEADPAKYFFSARKVGGGTMSSNFDMNLVHSGGGSYDMYGGYDGFYEAREQPQYRQQPQPIANRTQMQQPAAVPQQPNMPIKQTRQQIQQLPQQHPMQRQMQAPTPQQIKAEKSRLLAAIKNIFTNPQLKPAIKQAKSAMALQKAGIQAVTSGVKQSFGNIKNYRDLAAKFGNNKQFIAMDKQITDALKKKNMTDQAIANEKEKTFPEIKKQFTKMLLQQLKNANLDNQTFANISNIISKNI